MSFKGLVSLVTIGVMALACGSAFGQQVVKVLSHDKITVVTDPSTGNKHYPQWVLFPGKKFPVRRIILKVTFGCPDSMRCADWDYLDHITIRRAGGVNGKSLDIELARMLTPYGGFFTKDWHFDWTVDVTDFSSLLRDSVEIEYNHSGYEDNKDRGWKVSLEFDFLEGPPAFEAISVTKVYQGQFLYGDSLRSIEEDFAPFRFSKAPKAKLGKFRINQTGHGMNKGDGCGEFCDKWREVLHNGKVIGMKNLWMECSDNPLYPQAGTWIFDRANWCPGYLQQPDEYMFALQPDNAIDVNMQPYMPNLKSDARESVAAFVIQYKDGKEANDVALIDIINPTNATIYTRKSNINQPARIEIQNLGKEPLQSLRIFYGHKDGKRSTFDWKGNLASLQRTTIDLPGNIEILGAVNKYEVVLDMPNGKQDAFSADNSLVATFNSLPTHGGDLVVVVKTNKEPAHNSYKIFDSKGDVVAFRQFDTTQIELTIRDTLALKPGRYHFALRDTANNGLEFWYNTKGGFGLARIQDKEGVLVKQFDSDFGCCLDYTFEVSEDFQKRSQPSENPSIVLFPTRTTGSTTMHYFGNTTEDVKVQVTLDDGTTMVEEHVYKQLKEGDFTFSFGHRPPQRYYIKVFVKEVMVYNKRVRVIK